jgi:hypothetical protein
MDETRNSIREWFEAPEQPAEAPPKSYYSQAGDCAFFLFSDDPYYAERVDSVLTVYRSIESQERIIGAQIKGVSSLLKDAAGGESFLEVGVSSHGIHASEVVGIVLLSFKKSEIATKAMTYYRDVILAMSASGLPPAPRKPSAPRCPA